MFTIFGLSAGEALLRVYVQNAENPAVIDCETYLPIIVADSIFPTEVNVNVGASIAFSMAFPSLGTYKNYWSSSNESILTINIDGVAETHTPGRAVVHYNTSIRTKAFVNVLPISRIDTLQESLNASNFQFHVSVPLEFYGRRENRDIKLENQHGVDQRINYQCELKDNVEPEGFKIERGFLENQLGCFYTLVPLIDYEDAVEILVQRKLQVVAEIRAGHVIRHKPLELAPLFSISNRKLVFEENGPEVMSLYVNWR